MKDGTQKIYEATASGSKSKQDLETKIKECVAKIFILQKALFYFQGLELPTSAEDVPVFPPSSTVEITGTLQINVRAIAAIAGKKSSKTEMNCSVRVDNLNFPKAVTRKSKSTWSEDLNLRLEKAREVEIDVCESEGGVLGIVWFKISDLLIELLRVDPKNGAAGPKSTDVWLDLLPGGKIHLSLSYIPDKEKKRRDSHLVRQNAVQKFSVRQGHKFSPINSYPIYKCAVCKDFIISVSALNCQTCDFTCHKKCLDNVVPKCMSRDAGEMVQNQHLF